MHRGKVIQLRPKQGKRSRPKRRVKKITRLLPEPDPARVQLAFRNMAEALQTKSNIAQAENAQLGQVRDLLQAKTVFTLKLDAALDQLRVSTVRGRNDRRVAAATPGKGPVGLAFTGRVVREDGLLAVPLGLEPFGCLVILSPRYGPTDNLLTALASQVASACEVSALNDEMSRRTKDLQTAVAGLKSIEKGREKLWANVSGELKDPLSTIKAYLQMLSQEKLGPISERQRTALTTCEKNAERLHRMINDLLLVSSLEAGEMALASRPFGLKALVETVVEALSPDAVRQQIQLKLSGRETFLRGDRDHLSKAVRILLERALDGTPRNAEIKIAVSSDQGLATLSVCAPRMAIEPGALDHGVGALSLLEAKPHSFRRDFRLPAAAKIVRLHGGRLANSSTPEMPSITMYLPAFAGSVVASEAASTPRPGGVLIVDDDDDCREVLKEVLEEEGFPVFAAASAATARSMLADIRPALVLLDIHLSDDDGRVVLKHIREAKELKETPVYIISGASDGPAIASQKGGDRIDGFFEKPIRVPRLLETVSSIVQVEKAARPSSIRGSKPESP